MTYRGLLEVRTLRAWPRWSAVERNQQMDSAISTEVSEVRSGQVHPTVIVGQPYFVT